LKNQVKILFGIISLFILSGCASRCSRFYSKHPECLTIESDTVVTFDTIISERVSFDTALISSGEVDTFYIEIDKVKTRIIRQVDTLLVTQTIEPDTIIQTRTQIKERAVVQSNPSRWWIWLLAGFAAGLVLCVLRMRQ
jgi:hypothetical protein